MQVSRRTVLTSLSASLLVPQAGFARTPKEIMWEDLIPLGVDYPQIIGEGDMNLETDSWRPIFDANGMKLNPVLNGAYIKIPGYILPIDMSEKGVSSFVLVPYVGACLHTPPPPPNQLVFVTTPTPWPSDKLWDAVWVTGQMHHERQSTEVADTGYALNADLIAPYVW